MRTLQEKIVSLIGKEGGVLNETTVPARRRLAHRIKKAREAFLASLNFHLEPSKLEVLEKGLKSEEQIMRYLLVK